jgi:hypothetical protein
MTVGLNTRRFIQQKFRSDLEGMVRTLPKKTLQKVKQGMSAKPTEVQPLNCILLAEKLGLSKWFRR